MAIKKPDAKRNIIGFQAAQYDQFQYIMRVGTVFND